VEKINELLVDGAALAEWRRRLLETLSDFHRANPLSPGMSRAELKNVLPKSVPPKVYDSILARMTANEQISGLGDLVALAGHEPVPGPEEARLLEKMTALYRSGAFTPPTLREFIEQTGLSLLWRRACSHILPGAGKLSGLMTSSLCTMSILPGPKNCSVNISAAANPWRQENFAISWVPQGSLYSRFWRHLTG
jgi:hypothetical protein